LQDPYRGSRTKKGYSVRNLRVCHFKKHRKFENKRRA
jgi:hypothetical protein